jgi:hypothetical protein
LIASSRLNSAGVRINRSDEATKRAKGKTVITSSRPRTFSGIDDRSIIAKDGAGRQVCRIDVQRPEDVHHPLSLRT